MAGSDRYNQYPPGDSKRQQPSYNSGWGEPPPRPPPRPMRSGAMIRTRQAGMIVLMGVLLFFIGTIILQSTTLFDPPDSSDYDYEDYDKYRKEVEEYQDSVRIFIGVGRILNWVGAMIIVLPLYLVGITDEKLDWKVRASMLTTATAIVITTLIVTMFYTITPIF